MEQKEIGTRIRAMREARGLTQTEVAKALHVHQTAVSQWEYGRTRPDIDLLNKLASLYNVTTDELLGNDQSGEDEEIWALREELRRNPEFHMLFSLARGATKEDILKTVKILKTMKGED